MPIQGPQIFNALVAGRQARQQEDYTNNRNALAQQEVQNAPIEAQQRQQMNALSIQGAQQGQQMALDQGKAKQGYTALQYAKQSGNPVAFMLKQPGFAENAQKAGVNVNDPQDVKGFIDHMEAQLGSVIGVAPPVTQPFTLKPGETRFGTNGQPMANVDKPTAEMTPYQKEMLDIARQRLPKGGGSAQQFTTLTPEEIQAEGLPAGTVAQRSSQGKINVVRKPDAAGGGVKLTEGDKRARVLYSSVLNAEKDIMGAKGDDTSSGTQNALGSNALTRGLQSDEYRKYESAGLRWAANMLYLKSGATAPPEEVRSTWKQFFPQFGDGPEVKAQKAASRLQEINAVADAFGLDKSQIPKGASSQTPQGPTATGPNGQKLHLINGQWTPQ